MSTSSSLLPDPNCSTDLSPSPTYLSRIASLCTSTPIPASSTPTSNPSSDTELLMIIVIIVIAGAVLLLVVVVILVVAMVLVLRRKRSKDEHKIGRESYRAMYPWHVFCC